MHCILVGHELLTDIFMFLTKYTPHKDFVTAVTAAMTLLKATTADHSSPVSHSPFLIRHSPFPIPHSPIPITCISNILLERKPQAYFYGILYFEV